MRSKWRWILLVVLASGLVVGALYAQRARRVARIGAGYVAKEMCSCVFVAQRDFGSCRADIPASMARVRVIALEADAEVRAWLPLLAERTARYHEGRGCTLY